MTNEEYQAMRTRQEDWLEAHYDLNSIRGVQAIPESADLPKLPGAGVTGDLDYYLRFKAHAHEKAGNIDLAVLCLKKSNSIRMLKRIGYRKSDYYALVRLLARNGRLAEAYDEKVNIDDFFGEWTVDSRVGWSGQKVAKRILDDAKQRNTDLLQMNVVGCSCSECAKYQGRVFSISGKSKKFPRIPNAFFEYGAMSKYCWHAFYPYTDGVTDPMLESTLQLYPDIPKRYRKSIEAFSNRPFRDDRSESDIAKAIAHQEARQKKAAHEAELLEGAIDYEYAKYQDAQTLSWLHENLPSLCPKSVSGFRRMRTQNTKNYQKIVSEAAKLGHTIS
jgi:hypothetical protein